MACLYCHAESGDRDFCDETCYEEYQEAQRVFLEGLQDELPGESRYEDCFEYLDMFPDTQGGL